MNLKIIRNLKILARISKIFQLVSLFTSIVPVEKSLSSSNLYTPVSFPIRWSCPIYDAKWGKTIHKLHKGDFCSSAPSFKGKSIIDEDGDISYFRGKPHSGGSQPVFNNKIGAYNPDIADPVINLQFRFPTDRDTSTG